MTIKDLAAQTGYSVGTVSRVLNDQPNVSQKARDAILAKARETGFQLNVNARQLKQQHATSILVVVKGTSNELFSGLLEAIQTRIAQTRYPLLVDYVDEDANEVHQAVRLCREKKPLGVLFLGGNSDHFKSDFQKIDLPCVLVTGDASELGFPNLSSVSTDDREAARCAVDRLVALGHRKFALVGGDRIHSDISRLRYEGCLQSFQEHGIVFDEIKDYKSVRFSYGDGYRATDQLLAEGRKFTALFAASDVMAIGAMRALRDHGLQVPDDVSVMGFDGLPLGTYYIPQLSTVVQPVEQLARRSVELLISCIERSGAAQYLTVPFDVLQKESTAQMEEKGETMDA